jgi:RNA polymerase sigma factor (sigma-70 family)
VTLGDDFSSTLDSARAGRADAWEALYRDVAPIVLGYLRGKGARDPEDLLGTTFLNVVRDLDNFSGDEREFRSWVLTIAHRRSVDELRRSGRRVREVPDSASDRVPVGDAEADALERLDTAAVRETLSQLSPDQQAVILLRVLGDMTIEEVAKVLGKRPGAVKALQRRGYEALRRILD